MNEKSYKGFGELSDEIWDLIKRFEEGVLASDQIQVTHLVGVSDVSVEDGFIKRQPNRTETIVIEKNGGARDAALLDGDEIVQQVYLDGQEVVRALDLSGSTTNFCPKGQNSDSQ